MSKPWLLRAILLLLIMSMILFVSSCGSSTATLGFTYKPPFAPVMFIIDTSGTISIQGDLEIETLLGSFGLEATISDKLQPEDNILLLIIRHKQNGRVVDNVYKIQAGQDEVKVVTNGTTTIDVTQHKIFIDASKGGIQSIEVKDANSAAAASSIAETPYPTPTPDLHGLTITSAANLIIHFYDEKGLNKGWYLMKDITSMTSLTPEDSHMQSCVNAAYEYSFLYSPEIVQGTDENAFTLQFSGSSWTVVSMGGCTWDSSIQTTPSPQTPSATPPTYNQAVPLIKPYFDKSPYWSTGWVLYSVQDLTFRQQVGDHIGACISYTYAYWDNPNTPVGTDQRKFGFEYTNGTWQIDSVDNSYSMGHSSC